MPRRKLEDKNIRKLGRMGSGKSAFVTLPIDWIRDLGWKSKQKLKLSKKGSKIIIEDWEK